MNNAITFIAITLGSILITIGLAIDSQIGGASLIGAGVWLTCLAIAVGFE